MHGPADLQAAFAEFLDAAPGEVPSDYLAGALRQVGQQTAQRLSIYKNNVYARLVDALAATFPAVRRLVGTEFFRFAAGEFVKSHPARERTLHGYGLEFPGFIGSFAPAESVPYLADVARLEWLYLEAYHSREAEPLGADAFRRLVSGDCARIAMHPSARLMASRFPVSRIWELNVADNPITEKLRIDEGDERLLIVRPQATVEVRRLPTAAFAALTALQNGSAYIDCLTAAAAQDPGGKIHEEMLSLAAGATFVDRKCFGQ